MCLQKQLTSMSCVRFSILPPDNVPLEDVIDQCEEIEIELWSEGPDEDGNMIPVADFRVCLDYRSEVIAAGIIELDTPQGMNALKRLVNAFKKRKRHATDV